MACALHDRHCTAQCVHYLDTTKGPATGTFLFYTTNKKWAIWGALSSKVWKSTWSQICTGKRMRGMFAEREQAHNDYIRTSHPSRFKLAPLNHEDWKEIQPRPGIEERSECR